MNDSRMMNLLKILLGYLLYWTGILSILMRRFVKSGLYVLSYHSFNTFTNDYFRFGSLFISNYRDNFELQIKFFNRHFSKANPQVLSQESIGERAYLLTFDDGYKDNYSIAFPLLQKYKAPSIFFITTGYIGQNSFLWHDRVRYHYERQYLNGERAVKSKRACKKDLKRLKSMEQSSFQKALAAYGADWQDSIRLMMDWQEVKQCQQGGITIAPHSHEHMILSRLSSKEKSSDVEKSLAALKEKLDHPEIIHFCLPEGTKESMDSETLDLLAGNGIKVLFLTEPGVNTRIQKEKGIILMKRIGLNPSDPVPVVMLKIILASMRQR